MATALRMIVVAMLFIGIDVRFGAGVDLVPDLIGAVLVVVALAPGLHGRYRYFDWALPAAVVVLIAAVIDLLAPPEATPDVVRLLDAIATGAAAWLVLSALRTSPGRNGPTGSRATHPSPRRLCWRQAPSALRSPSPWSGLRVCGLGAGDPASGGARAS